VYIFKYGTGIHFSWLNAIGLGFSVTESFDRSLYSIFVSSLNKNIKRFNALPVMDMVVEPFTEKSIIVLL
jgi:hypothetical protein